MTGPQLMTTVPLPDPPINTRFQYRHQYDDARDAIEREASATVMHEPSMTMQQFTEDANLNIVLKRFGVGDGSHLPGLEALGPIDPSYYGDFTNAVDLKGALNAMLEAERRFMDLPAELRARFHNNWVELHDWVNDPANLDEAIELKMLVKPPAPVQTPVTAPAPTPTPTTPPSP